MSTINDALLAELLGDVGKLRDEIKALPEQLSITTGKMIQVSDDLAKSTSENMAARASLVLASMEQKQKTLYTEMKAAIREETDVMIGHLTKHLKAALVPERAGRYPVVMIIASLLLGIVTGVISAFFIF